MTGVVSLIGDEDLHYFNEGTHRRLAGVLGAHLVGGADDGARFAVWAPNAQAVGVVGDFCGWRSGAQPLDRRGASGIWEGYVPSAHQGHVYKFEIAGADGVTRHKADPYAFCTEEPPRTGSVVWDLGYAWSDQEWMATRAARVGRGAPVSIYEVHLGSWRRSPEDPHGVLGYRDLGLQLAEYAVAAGFTHVELLPVMEHPFYGSWGYQTTGYFAPSRRHGTPQDLMALVDTLHGAGIGVIFDWVPSHFPDDDFALARFDGTHLYEHADARLGVHPDWGSLVFNYGRHEVRAFLASSAHHWLSTYHADGLRMDAVASMLYRDYSRRAGEWIPNEYGGRENLEAVGFLRSLNVGVYAEHPDVCTIAEESTAWPGVSRPPQGGGLGFGYKWDMGWMHDTLEFCETDPVYRSYDLGRLTFRSVYAFSESFVLPLSHDEVVHGKGSLLDKMPGDDWQRFATLRLLLGYQFTTPGKKLLFMGAELAERREWDHERSLDWDLLDHPSHAGVARLVADLNRLYRDEQSLHVADCDPDGFSWVIGGDPATSVLAYLRRAPGHRCVVAVLNWTPVPRHEVAVAVPAGGRWLELLNTDAEHYGGSGMGNLGAVAARPAAGGGAELGVTVPPLACLVLAPERAR